MVTILQRVPLALPTVINMQLCLLLLIDIIGLLLATKLNQVDCLLYLGLIHHAHQIVCLRCCYLYPGLWPHFLGFFLWYVICYSCQDQLFLVWLWSVTLFPLGPLFCLLYVDCCKKISNYSYHYHVYTWMHWIHLTLICQCWVYFSLNPSITNVCITASSIGCLNTMQSGRGEEISIPLWVPLAWNPLLLYPHGEISSLGYLQS